MALYALATVLFLPSSVLTLAGGDRLSAAGSAIRTAERAGALNKQQRSNRLPHRPALTPGRTHLDPSRFRRCASRAWGYDRVAR